MIPLKCMNLVVPMMNNPAKRPSGAHMSFAWVRWASTGLYFTHMGPVCSPSRAHHQPPGLTHAGLPCKLRAKLSGHQLGIPDGPHMDVSTGTLNIKGFL